MADERKRRRWPFLLLALLVFYPLSLGPLWWLWGNGYIGDDTLNRVGTLYRPLFRLEEHSETVSKAMKWYVRLWWDAM